MTESYPNPLKKGRQALDYKELSSIYPYGLNYDFRKVDNISKKWMENVVVWALSNENLKRDHLDVVGIIEQQRKKYNNATL